MRITDLRVESIVSLDRLRALDDEKVEAIRDSIAQIGLLHPVTVWHPEDGAPELISGAHRLEAVKRLGWEYVPTVIRVDATRADAELAEIDENLMRAELSPAERAWHVHRRKELYEKQHEETQHGSTIGKERSPQGTFQSGNSYHSGERADRFTADTYRRTGRSERSVRLDAHRGDKLKDDIRDLTGTSLDQGDELDALAKLPEEERADLIRRAKAGEKISAKQRLKQIRRDEKEQRLAERSAEISNDIGYQVYNVIYADPPWRFEPYSRETGMDRAADNHYPTENVEAIADLAVPDACAPDCVLFLWATAPMLLEAFQVMDAWGFTYKSHLIWVKDRIGTGYWARNKHELLLIGTRGDPPAPAMGTQSDSVVDAPLGVHSEKPEIFYQLIEQHFPSVPKLEMFARNTRPGWDAWGNEASSNEAA